MVTVFTYNRHAAYLYLLSHVDVDLYVVGEWSTDTRPHPKNVTFVSENKAEKYAGMADVWLSHIISPDLIEFLKLGVRIGWPERLIQIMHGRSDRVGHIDSTFNRFIYRQGKQAVQPFLKKLGDLIPLKFVHISKFVAESWNVGGSVVMPAVISEIERGNTDQPWRHPLVVANDINRTHFARNIMMNLHDEFNIRVCGSNPDLSIPPGRVSWNNLLKEYARSSCYLNLLRPPENSFNLATLEAIGSGTPIITLEHPRSVFKHERTALICSDESEVREALQRLMGNRSLRNQLSNNAQKMAEDIFGIDRFRNQWNNILE